MKRIAIVSPSGNYYGSEKVLYDFLCFTKNAYEVYVPSGKFYDILRNTRKSNLHIHSFKSVKALYARLFWLLTLNVIDGVYINEAGHSRYVKILAKIFPRKRFFIHVRLLEDTKEARIGNLPPNTTLISVSDYISKEIRNETGQSAVSIIDIYRIKNTLHTSIKSIPIRDIQIGIVGRLTDTKGLDDLIDFCDYVENNPIHKLTLNFYGDINQESANVIAFVRKSSSYKNLKCIFHGYVDGAECIYPNINILLHFNRKEPLGRIAFEALDYGIPFIGFNSGGIGEIARKLSLTDVMIDPNESNTSELILCSLNHIISNSSVWDKYSSARLRLPELCSPLSYTNSIESLFGI